MGPNQTLIFWPDKYWRLVLKNSIAESEMALPVGDTAFNWEVRNCNSKPKKYTQFVTIRVRDSSTLRSFHSRLHEMEKVDEMDGCLQKLQVS
jgi:hypothetical protein